MKTIEEIRTERRNETKSIKKALEDAGYVAKVGHGRGSAWGWIYVSVVGTWTYLEWSKEHNDRVYAAIKKTAGREHLHDDGMTDYYVENISLDYSQRPITPEECAGMLWGALEAKRAATLEYLAILEDNQITEGRRVEVLRADLETLAHALRQDLPRPDPETDARVKELNDEIQTLIDANGADLKDAQRLTTLRGPVALGYHYLEDCAKSYRLCADRLDEIRANIDGRLMAISEKKVAIERLVGA